MKNSLKIDKRWIVLIVLIIILIFVINNRIHVRNNENIDPCYYSNIKSHYPKNCYIKTAVERNDFMFCNKLEGVYGLLNSDNLMGTCYTKLAVLNKDISLCEKPTGRYLEVVKSNCYVQVALSTNDLSICDISPSKDGCLAGMSEKRKDVKLCEKMKNESSRYNCFENRTKDSGYSPSFCNEINAIDGKEICVRATAHIHKDVSLCKTIQNISIRNNCYYTVAWSTKNISICNKILNNKENNSTELIEQCNFYSR